MTIILLADASQVAKTDCMNPGSCGQMALCRHRNPGLSEAESLQKTFSVPAPRLTSWEPSSFSASASSSVKWVVITVPMSLGCCKDKREKKYKGYRSCPCIISRPWIEKTFWKVKALSWRAGNVYNVLGEPVPKAPLSPSPLPQG